VKSLDRAVPAEGGSGSAKRLHQTNVNRRATAIQLAILWASACIFAEEE
jgi:hypothetical protein